MHGYGWLINLIATSSKYTGSGVTLSTNTLFKPSLSDPNPVSFCSENVAQISANTDDSSGGWSLNGIRQCRKSRN